MKTMRLIYPQWQGAYMGMGDEEIVGQLPGMVAPEAVCLTGLRECEYPYIKQRVEDLHLTHFSPAQLAQNSGKVIEWLNATGKSKVMVHFDMDVIDTADMIAAVADGPEGGMKMQEVVRLIGDIAAAKNLVDLTVAEPMPRIAIRLKVMLAHLPLMK